MGAALEGTDTCAGCGVGAGGCVGIGAAGSGMAAPRLATADGGGATAPTTGWSSQVAAVRDVAGTVEGVWPSAGERADGGALAVGVGGAGDVGAGAAPEDKAVGGVGRGAALTVGPPTVGMTPAVPGVAGCAGWLCAGCGSVGSAAPVTAAVCSGAVVACGSVVVVVGTVGVGAGAGCASRRCRIAWRMAAAAGWTCGVDGAGTWVAEVTGA